MRRVARLLCWTAVAALALALLLLIAWEVAGHRADFEDERPHDDGLDVSVELVVRELDASVGAAAGTVRVRLSGPRLQLARLPPTLWVSVARSDAPSSQAGFAGRSEPIVLTQNPFAALVGSAPIAVDVRSERGAVLYPFDRHRLDVYVSAVAWDPARPLNPRTLAADAVSIRVAAPAVVASDVTTARWAGTSPGAAPGGVGRSILLTRPVSLQFVAGAAGLAALVFLLFLIREARIEAILARLVALFAGLWGLRTVFGADIGIPTLADYLSMAASVLAVAIVVTRWWLDTVHPGEPRCPQCLEPVNAGAARCRHCASPLPAEVPAPKPSPAAALRMRRGDGPEEPRDEATSAQG